MKIMSGLTLSKICLFEWHQCQYGQKKREECVTHAVKLAILEVKLLAYACAYSKLNLPPKGATTVWIMVS